MTAARGTRQGSLTSFLRRLPLLADLPDEELQRLAAAAGRKRVAAGHVLMHEGDQAHALYVLLRGRLEVTRSHLGEEVLVGVHRRGAFVGEMALLGDGARSATVRAVRPSELLVISAASFQELLLGSPGAALAVLRTVAERLRGMETIIVQREKLTSLGTLAAGLAHELNNPASAASAAARQLARAVPVLEQRTLALAASPALMARVQQVAGALEASAAASRSVDAAGSCDAQEALAGWLHERGLDAPRAAASALAGGGFDAARLSAFIEGLDAAEAGLLLDWLAASCDVQALTREVGAAAHAVHDVVTAVSAWVNLDRMPAGAVDLRASLATTLSILRPRIAAGVVVDLHAQPAMPPVEANPGELGQVWANLLGNAIDAVGASGRIGIRICRRGERAVVEVEDTGPGIPSSLRRRIFEPFFTTKPVQSGTGLGLHIVRSIVVHRHGGRVDLQSRPGRTVFRVMLPLRTPARPPDAHP